MATPQNEEQLQQVTLKSKALASDENEMEALELLLKDLEEMDQMFEELKRMEAA